MNIMLHVFTMCLKLDKGATISKLDTVAFMTLFTDPRKHNEGVLKSLPLP